ncbi:MAG: DNA repair protein RecO [Pseudorhodoplanes sp.]|uniref:DNA repair protein RecO n=1 Tax=Pseudorhodoplanes sp. TaxID=1934341 RepID=UPI003D13BC31
MQWSDDGFVLGIRRHGEANAILELMTRAHGRHLGLVRGGTGSRMRPVLQPGNSVRVQWRARLDDHLGTFTVEPVALRAGALFSDRHALFAVTHLAALARLLPERDPHEIVFDGLEAIVGRLHDPVSCAALTVRFELLMLSELGFGLDLDACAATGSRSDLVYVSPKSGRAVSRDAGAPWRDRLLALPAFVSGEAEPHGEADVGAKDIEDGFALTAFFLARHVMEPRGLTLSDARAHFIAAVCRRLPDAA